MGISDIVENAKNELAKEKSSAAWLAGMELSDYISYSAIAKNYFGKGANWLLQRLHGYNVNGKPAKFKPEEYTILAKSFREIAEKLNRAADNIETAQQD